MVDDYTPSVEYFREFYAVESDGAISLDEARAEFDRMIAKVRAEEREKAAQIAEEAEDLRAAYLDFWGAHSSNDIQRVGREPRLVVTPMLDRIREQGS